ncbi:MAG TPA: TIGR03032 family protein [Acidimicrobiales bacterium]|nr:TIGR03032 family protein [Acidimicrobiales bacterium]
MPPNDEAAELQISYSPGLEGWLAAERTSLAFAIPPSKLFFIGLQDDGRLSAFERTFSKSMGVAAAGPDTIYLGTRYQIWRLENPPGGGAQDGFDRCFVPRRVWTTGYINCHDVAVDGDGSPIFVNTRFGCLATVSDQYSFVPLWWPPYQSRRTQGDCCHLNGVAMEGGKPAFVTSVSSTGELDSWRRLRNGGGVVTHVPTGEIVCRGLSMPHSPRLYRGDLWITNSGTGEVGRVDLDAGVFRPLAFAPGFLRGLTFVGDYAVVGSSRFRGGGLYSGLPLDDALATLGMEPKLGLFIVHLGTGAIVEWLLVEGPMTEMFDVIALPGVRRPMALGLISDEIEHAIWYDSGALARA